MLRPILGSTLALLLATGPLVGQQGRAPEDGGLTRSLGQPSRSQWHAGAGAGWIFRDGVADLVAEGRFGIYHALLSPPSGLVGVQFETYAGARGSAFDYGARGQLVSPYLRLGVGIDLNGLDHENYFLLTLSHPLRRGGIVGRGGHLRVNYLPGREHSFSVGVQVPVGTDAHMGRTRPRHSAVRLPPGHRPPLDGAQPSPAMQAVMDTIASTAQWITRMTAPFLEHSQMDAGHEEEIAMRDLRVLAAYLEQRRAEHGDWGPEDEVRRLHADIERAFSMAAGGGDLGPGECTPLGVLLAEQAQSVILDEILLPYDRLLGQVKKPASLLGLGIHARGIFLRWLHTDARSSPEHIAANLWVFTRLVDVLEEVRESLHERWNDSRFVWLPLQLALRPEQHDSQTEIDRIIARLSGVEFTEGNRVWYVVNEQFPLQLARMIHAAEKYHVLWVHDLRGRDDFGNLDEMSFRNALGAYLAALTRRVREYDRTGSFPVYMIFLDQWYYQGTGGRIWLDLLEDPLHHEIDFPAGYESWRDTLAAAQSALREAVAASGLLQVQAAQYGKDWLRNLVKVHVNVTNPSDPSYGRNELIPLFGMPDNLMRDHRKIAFYDITEEDPYSGGAIYTGAGVGEHYVTLGWEDRAIVAEGPALLTLKTAARTLLLTQGIPPEEIPWALQPRPLAADYAAKIQAHRDTARFNVRALEVHNETGYGTKSINAVKASFYSLMPPGSVAIVPDALWGSGFWAGLLVGNALRGGRSLIVAPAPTNAPTARMHVMSRAYDVQFHVLHAADILRRPISDRGGLLKVGIYAPTFEVTDLHAKMSAFYTTLREHDWFRSLYQLSPGVMAEMEQLLEQLRHQNERWERTLRFEKVGPPELHLKANFLASREAWEGLLGRPEWTEVLRAFTFERAWQIENRDRSLGHLDSSVPHVIDVGKTMVDRWLAVLTPAERDRLVLYLLVGSHNQNYRSMVMDGEAAFLVSGTSINAGLIDLVSITGQSEWVESVDELERWLPRPAGWQLWLTRRIRIIL